MKQKLFILSLLFLFTLNAVAVQPGSDDKELKKFLKQLKKVEGKHVDYEKYDADSVCNDVIQQFAVFGYADEAAKQIKISEALSVSSKDSVGYSLLNEIIDDFELGERDEFAGMSLMVNEKSSNSLSVVYCNDNASMLITDDVKNKKTEIVYFDFNIMNLMSMLMDVLMGQINESPFGQIADSLKSSGKVKKWTSFGDIKFSISNQDDSEDEDIKNIDKPMLKEIDGKWRIVTPKSYVATLDEVSEPHRDVTALWLNVLNFGDFVESDNQLGWLINADNFLALYCNEFYGKPVEIEYPSAEYQAIYNTLVDGGMPYMVCRYSANPEGRKEILKDIGFLFESDCDSFFTMKKTASYKNPQGQHYCQFYNEKSILYIYDNPVDETCLACVFVPSTGIINSYLQQCKVNGKAVDDANFVIYKFGVTVSKKTFDRDGETHNSGVHISIKDIDDFYKNNVKIKK